MASDCRSQNYHKQIHKMIEIIILFIPFLTLIYLSPPRPENQVVLSLIFSPLSRYYTHLCRIYQYSVRNTYLHDNASQNGIRIPNRRQLESEPNQCLITMVFWWFRDAVYIQNYQHQIHQISLEPPNDNIHVGACALGSGNDRIIGDGLNVCFIINAKCNTNVIYRQWAKQFKQTLVMREMYGGVDQDIMIGCK
eukprot:450392_1